MLKTILRIFAATIAGVVTVAGVFLLRRTYIEPWLAVAIGVCGGAVITRLLLRRTSSVTGIRNSSLATITVLAAASGLTFGSFLTINYAGADTEESELIEAVIISKRTRSEHPTRRVGRGRYVPDTSRTIYHYYYTLQLPDGHTLERITKAENYRHITIGKHKTVTMQRGALGWKIIK